MNMLLTVNLPDICNLNTSCTQKKEGDEWLPPNILQINIRQVDKDEDKLWIFSVLMQEELLNPVQVVNR